MLDHLARHGRWLGWGPARHGIAGNIASYVRIVEEECFVELYCDMEQLQDDHVPRVYPDDRYSSNTWGPLPPRSYFRFDPVAIEYERESLETRGHVLPPLREEPARLMPLRGYTIPRSPEGRSSLVPYPPWHYVGDFLVVEFWADPEKAVSCLPAGLDPHPDPGRCAFVFADWQSCSSGRRRAARSLALAVQGGVPRRQRAARRRGGDDLPVHLGRPRLRAHPRLAAGLPEEARLDLDHAHLRPRQPGRPRRQGGSHVRRHLRRLRAPGRGGDGDPRSDLRERPDPQRPADRQRAPLRPARGRSSRRPGRARARTLPQPRPGASHRSGRAARRSSSSAPTTRSTTCSRPCGSARASASRSGTPSTTRRSSRICAHDPGCARHRRRHGHRRRGRATAGADGFDVAVTGRREGPIGRSRQRSAGSRSSPTLASRRMPSGRSRRRSTASAGSTRSSSTPGSPVTASLVDMEPGLFEDIFRVNVTGAFLTARAAISTPARAPWRNRHDRIGLGPAGSSLEPRVLLVEGRSGDADAVHRARPRPGRRACELHLPRLGADADGGRGDGWPGPAVARGGIRGCDEGRAAAAAEHARGDRRNGRAGSSRTMRRP